MMIKVGDTVELNNGEINTVEKMTPSSKGDPLWCDQSGYGTFVIGGVLYHQDGRFANLGHDDDLSVKRIISRASDTPKIWRDMTDEEKGALLLAHHEGKLIEAWSCGMWLNGTPNWNDNAAYRVKPETVRKVVTIYSGWPEGGSWAQWRDDDDTHRITFETVDGKPDCSTIKMEELD